MKFIGNENKIVLCPVASLSIDKPNPRRLRLPGVLYSRMYRTVPSDEAKEDQIKTVDNKERITEKPRNVETLTTGAGCSKEFVVMRTKMPLIHRFHGPRRKCPLLSVEG